MGVLAGKEWAFDTAASKYERMRPGYTEDLYKQIFDYCPIDKRSKLIEVGIGGGQATLPFLQKNCNVTAIEYGKNLVDICREKFKEHPGFEVITSKFEDVEFNDNAYDLIYSASAFHWIPEEIGYTKVYKALKPGGVFARFANHPFRCKNEPDLASAIDASYEKYYYKYYNKEPQKITEYSEEDAKRRAYIAEKYGFSDIQYGLFYRIREFTAKEYVDLLGTYSDHIAIDESIRTSFFKDIEKIINSFGGVIRIYDTMDLQLARKVK